MLIDNFEKIKSFMKFTPDSFYKFEALTRNSDGDNPLFREGLASHKKNMLIKDWYVTSFEELASIEHEMKTLCDLTGARLYIGLNRKNTRKFFSAVAQYFASWMSEFMRTYQLPSLKSIKKVLASKSSVVETTDKDGATLMFDIDTRDEEVKSKVLQWIRNHANTWIVLESKKGWHIATNRIDRRSWNDYVEFHPELRENVSLLENSLGLVYMNLTESTLGLEENIGEEND